MKAPSGSVVTQSAAKSLLVPLLSSGFVCVPAESGQASAVSSIAAIRPRAISHNMIDAALRARMGAWRRRGTRAEAEEIPRDRGRTRACIARIAYGRMLTAVPTGARWYNCRTSSSSSAMQPRVQSVFEPLPWMNISPPAEFLALPENVKNSPEEVLTGGGADTGPPLMSKPR